MPCALPRERASERPKVIRTRQFFCSFDLEMCFAPQWCTRFRHRNFQKCSEPGLFCAFWLRNVLRATMACNFSSLIWPDGSAPAAQCFAALLPFQHLHLLSSASFSFLIFFLLLFSSLTFPASAFPFVHIVGSLTSKLPSDIYFFFVFGVSTRVRMGKSPVVRRYDPQLELAVLHSIFFVGPPSLFVTLSSTFPLSPFLLSVSRYFLIYWHFPKKIQFSRWCTSRVPWFSPHFSSWEVLNFGW